MKTIIILSSIAIVLAVVAFAILSHPAFGRKPSAERKARIENSANWRNGMFHNQIPTPQFTGRKGGFRTLWEFLTDNDARRTPSEPLNAVKTDLKNLPPDTDLLVWFGHSSYLFRLGGKTFLVDPVLKTGFPSSLMMKPFKGTDIYSPDDLPDIDCLIITHEHWDHLDYATLCDLREKVHYAVCPLGVGEYLEYWGYDKNCIYETDWYEQTCLPTEEDGQNILITCLPTRHFSNRLLSRNQTLWASYMVQNGSRKVYIGGDGGYDGRFSEIRETYGRVDLALMENGQYNKDWANIHLLPEDLERAILDLDAKQVFTVHHDKFALAKHAWDEPDNVAKAIAQKDNIVLLDQPIGTIVEF
ncbi:MAG: MBL fold metallo-hydrolase [Paludibacteraceae bacterium]|nr:MBL fold metallo-hydrolase [Paludibacteraceae bacterium]